MYSVLDYWHFNLEEIENDNYPHATVQQPRNTSFNQPLLMDLVIGGIHYEQHGNKTISRATAFKTLFYLRAEGDPDSKKGKEWNNILSLWEKALAAQITQFSDESELIDTFFVSEVRIRFSILDIAVVRLI